MVDSAFKADLATQAFRAQQRRFAAQATEAPSPTSRTMAYLQQDIDTFQQHLLSSDRILALCGAGLSAASGLPTFRGAGGLWRNNDATMLATEDAFDEDPAKVWQFYEYRRHMALKAKPNRAHYALAELARRKPNFLTISQNVDGLSPRANHPIERLELLHGSLSTVKCSSFTCDYIEYNNFTDPIVPALEIPKEQDQDLDISNSAVPLREVSVEDLPHCPKCRQALLRPGVVWFGEGLPEDTVRRIDEWTSRRNGNIDLMIVIGTSARVYPAAGYIHIARSRGAKVAVFNTEFPDQDVTALTGGGWFFQGDAAEILPELLKPIIGDLAPP